MGSIFISVSPKATIYAVLLSAVVSVCKNRTVFLGGEISISGGGEGLHPFLTKTNPRKNQAFEFWKHLSAHPSQVKLFKGVNVRDQPVQFAAISFTSGREKYSFYPKRPENDGIILVWIRTCSSE
jgi:hypothetical protein